MMKISKKNMIIIGSVCALVIVSVLVYRFFSGSVTSSHVIKNNSEIRVSEVLSYESVDFNDPKNIREFLSEGKVNGTTLSFLDFIMNKFPDASSFEEHYEQVREYLYSVLPSDEAEKMLSLYKKYIEYQRGMERDVLKWDNPTDTASAIKYLDRLQEYRRDTLGEELADSLFGADVKSKEYQIRRNDVISDKDVYGAEKEAALKKLDVEMWGDDADQASQLQKPYDTYMDKLNMYKKDFSEMSPEEQQTKIKEFREQNFTPEVVKRLEEVDKVIAADKDKDATYREKES
ncbi:MAG: lipase secretion chaperone, partial [Spirochaetota bacterium]